MKEQIKVITGKENVNDINDKEIISIFGMLY